MKKTLIISGLLISTTLLGACTNKAETIEENTQTWEIVENIETGDIIESTWTLDTIQLTGETTISGNSTITTGNQDTIIKIKTLIDNRKKELEIETWTKKELTEKDIDLLESIVNELSRKK